MRARVKIGLVAAGYVGAFLVAAAAVALHVASTRGPDRHAASGMYAFGDGLLFLAVFGVAAIAPTGAAFFFLRSRPTFWRICCVVALAIAVTGLTALIAYVGGRAAGPGSTLQAWAAVAVLRILVAPLFALVFLAGGMLAPARVARIVLLVTTLSEAAVVGVAGLVLFQVLLR